VAGGSHGVRLLPGKLQHTRFGLSSFHGTTETPELIYNVTLKRIFGSPFIAAFLPIAAVAGLLFTLLLTVSQLGDTVKATGYSYLNFLRTTIALFFSLVVAKLAFWPVLLGCFYINSLFFLW
jgi:hypothetical protein